MVARTRTHHGDLLVVFSRDGEQDDARPVPNGERAMVQALMMISARGALQAGDRLLVRPDEPEGMEGGTDG